MKIIIHACPFCDHDDVELDEVDVKCFAVRCPECEAIGPISRENIQDAIGKWNAARAKSLSSTAEAKIIKALDRGVQPKKISS